MTELRQVRRQQEELAARAWQPMPRADFDVLQLEWLALQRRANELER